MINNDERIGGKIKVAFIPNYGVSAAEVIIPAADLSEQISTAGKEASGTGNMKLALNGALTIGTLDGANVEIGEEVGDENIFIFGLTVEEVEDLWANGYNPYDLYWADPELKDVIDWLSSTAFAPKGSFEMIRGSLLDGGDPYLCTADHRAYVAHQAKVYKAYPETARWAERATLNNTRAGYFTRESTHRADARGLDFLKP